MDTITQGLLGAVTAQLGFRQRIGPEATWIATASAILPDLDMLITPFLTLSGAEAGPLTSATIHRGLSHSLLLAPVLAAPIAMAWWWFRRRGASRRPQARRHRPPPLWLLYACVLVAVVTHPLLDWFTSYGTQLLAPLTNARFALDAVPIVDIIYSPLLIVTLLACYVTRRTRPPRQAAKATIAIGWVGFLLSTCYLLAGLVMNDWAISKAVQAAASVDGKVIRADAYPALGTIFLWRTVVETDGKWIVRRVHHFSTEPPANWPTQIVDKANHQWISKARQLEAVKTYDWFAGGRLRAQYEMQNGLHAVTFHDMRYGWPQESVESLWPLTVIFRRDGEVVHVGRERRAARGGFGQLLSGVWRDIWNP